MPKQHPGSATRMDHQILLMLQPRLDDIQSRFAQSGILTTEDVHTLLLQSQYNHIEHLDIEITRIREEMHREIGSLRSEFGTIRTEFGTLRGDFAALRGDVNTLRSDLRADIKESQVSATRWNIAAMATLVAIMQALNHLV
jgi:hypothetical protein